MKNNPEALFIVFEGIDGSGKTTQSEMLRSFLVERGIESRWMREPSDGEWGREIREILKGEEMPGAREMLRLFISDRADDVRRNIIPALEENISIIMDRYYYSNAAYQGAMGLSPEEIIRENRKMSFPEPDRVYLIDTTPELALERLAGRNSGGERELFERGAFLEKVRDIYHRIAGENFFIVDGSGNVDEIFRLVSHDCMTLMGLKK